MKKINLKRAIQLPNAEKTVLRPGIHKLSEDLFAHWFIQGLITMGDIVVMDENEKPNVLQSLGKPAVVSPQPVLQKVGPAVVVTAVEGVEEILPKDLQTKEEVIPAPPEEVVGDTKVSVTTDNFETEKPKKIVRRKKKS